MTKDMATRQNGAVAVATERPLGLEEPSLRQDLIIPRSKLLQALSPECVEGAGRPGQIINSLTKEILPSEFVPVVKFYQWIRFNPLDPSKPGFVTEYEGKQVKAGDVLWQSFQWNDPRVLAEGEFGTNNERPIATKFINFLSFFPGVDMPVVVSFSNTSLKAGRQLLSQLEFLKSPIWTRKFKLGSKLIKDGQFNYHILTVEPMGDSTEDMMTVASSWHSRYGTKKASDLDIHTEEPKGEF